MPSFSCARRRRSSRKAESNAKYHENRAKYAESLSKEARGKEPL